MARAATETQRAGLTGLEFGLAIPGTVGRRRVGQRRRPRRGRGGGPRVGPRPRRGWHRGDRRRPRTSPWPTATAASSTGRPTRGAARDVVVDATFRLAPADPEVIKARLDDIRHWRQAHQPLGLPSAGSVFRNPAGDSAGRLIDEAGLKGLRIGGAVVSEKHANFIVNDQKGSAADVRRLAERVRAEVLARDGVALAFEVEFVGDWSGVGGRPGDDRRPRGSSGRAASAPGRGPAGWPVGRARRLDRLGHGHRRRAA